MLLECVLFFGLDLKLAGGTIDCWRDSSDTERYVDESVMLTFCRENMIVDIHSRRQSSRLKRAKRLSGGPKFEIKHKSHCLQKKKLVNWGPSMSIGGARPSLGAGPVVIVLLKERPKRPSK